MMQVIAIEDGNWLRSLKYHKSNKKIFATYDPDYFEEENTLGEERDGDVGVENLDTAETELDTDTVRILLDRNTHIKRKEKKEEEKGFLEKNFFLLIVGGCLAGIVLVIILVSILLSLRGKLCKKTRVEEDEEPGDVPAPDMISDRNLSNREQRVLSLFMKSS